MTCNGRCSYDVICKALDRNKKRQSQPASPSPKPMRQQPKHEPSAVGKVLEAGADMVEGLGNALGGLFQIGPAYDPEEEAFINEMKRRQKRKRGRSV